MTSHDIVLAFGALDGRIRHATVRADKKRKEQDGAKYFHGVVERPNSINQRQDFCRDTSTTTTMILRIRLSRRLLREATVGYQGVRPTTTQHRNCNICIATGFNSVNPLTGNRFPSMPVGYHGILRQQSRDHPCCDGSDTCEGACQGNFPLNVARDTRGPVWENRRMNSARSREEYATGSHRRPKEGLVPNPKAPLRAQIHEVMRFFHYSRRTEQTYCLSAFAKASAGQVLGWFLRRRKRLRSYHADDVRRGKPALRPCRTCSGIKMWPRPRSTPM
jgi:hypothetical protein